jgi:2-deoxy-D-gluconate 3-dehydrogenase
MHPNIESIFDLSGKVAIVTGCAADGIGEILAEGLAEAGADIVGVDIRPVDSAKQRVEAVGRRFLGLQTDLSKRESLPGIVEQTVAAFGKVDILVNVAGIDLPCTVDGDWESYYKVVELNQHSLIELSTLVFQQMVKQGTGGKILNFASVMAYIASPDSLPYTTAKNAVIGATINMGVSGMPHGICVNALAPGYVRTKLTEKTIIASGFYERSLQVIPAHRPAEPEELKGVTLFYCSPASDYITGTVMKYDAGMVHNADAFFA